MKIMYLFITILILSLLVVGCGRCTDEDYLTYILSDWAEFSIDYNGNGDGKFFGTYKKDGIIYNYYELEGMDKNNYLFVTESSFAWPSEYSYVYINRSAPLPILVYDIKEIKIKWNNTQKVIDDEQVINNLKEILQINKGVNTTHKCQNINTSVYFDLPCELVWNCHIHKDEDGSFNLIFIDHRSGDCLSYDITEVFEKVLR